MLLGGKNPAGFKPQSGLCSGSPCGHVHACSSLRVGAAGRSLVDLCRARADPAAQGHVLRGHLTS